MTTADTITGDQIDRISKHGLMRHGRNVTVPVSVIKALVDDHYAWPTGAAISGWRRLVRLGHAVETTGICEGCKAHRRGHVVPVFELLDGVRLVSRWHQPDAAFEDA